MKRILISLALSFLLVGCNNGGNKNPLPPDNRPPFEKTTANKRQIVKTPINVSMAWFVGPFFASLLLQLDPENCLELQNTNKDGNIEIGVTEVLEVGGEKCSAHILQRTTLTEASESSATAQMSIAITSKTSDPKYKNVELNYDGRLTFTKIDNKFSIGVSGSGSFKEGLDEKISTNLSANFLLAKQSGQNPQPSLLLQPQELAENADQFERGELTSQVFTAQNRSSVDASFVGNVVNIAIDGVALTQAEIDEMFPKETR